MSEPNHDFHLFWCFCFFLKYCIINLKLQYVTIFCAANYYYYFDFCSFHCCNNRKSSHFFIVTYNFYPVVCFMTVSLIGHSTIYGPIEHTHHFHSVLLFSTKFLGNYFWQFNIKKYKFYGVLLLFSIFFCWKLQCISSYAICFKKRLFFVMTIFVLVIEIFSWKIVF